MTNHQKYKAKTDRIEGTTDVSIIIVGKFNVPLSILERTTREKISKESRLTAINQLD